MGRALAVAAALLAGACRSSDGSDAGADRGEARVAALADLLEMEDRRLQAPVVLGELTSAPDALVRARAGLAAGRLKDPETVQYLPVLLRDAEAEVRRAAAFAAGISGDRRLVPVLGQALADGDPSAAAAAATALGRLGGEDAARLLREVLERRSGPLAAAALASARFRDAAFTPLLLRAAHDPSPEVHRAVAFGLARAPLSGSEGTLRELLASNDPQVVAWAARGLGLLEDAAAADLLAALAGTPEPSVAVQSLLALDRIAARAPLPGAAREAAFALARESSAPGVALAALTLLRRAAPGDAPVSARLADVAASGGRRGAVALASLALLDPVRAEALAFVPSAPTALRLGAAEALATVPREVALRWAGRLLSDPVPRVRMEALGRFPREQGPLPQELLGRALSDRDGAVRAAALEAAAPALTAPAGPAPLDGLRRLFEEAFVSAVTSGEADWAVTALDAAAAVPGGEQLLRRQADARDDVVRERARRLLVERFGARKEGFAAVAGRTRLDRAGYRRVAREAASTRFVATVTTSRGAFEIELLTDVAPLTVDSFVALAGRRAFDGTVIHRVVPDFVVQAGDPRGDGTGGPGYAIRDELSPLPYARGTVGMALSGPDTGGSQWFVTLSRQPHLDGAYTVFGAVVSGLEVLDAVEQDDALVSVAVRREKRRGASGASGPGERGAGKLTE